MRNSSISEAKRIPNGAIILLGHGSRVPEAGEDMEKVAERLKLKYSYQMVEICFMSRLGPHFTEVFERCVNQGATRVVVIPYFLHAGLHIVLDIPEMLQKEGRKFPDVQLILGKGLGYDEALVDLVHKKIEASMELPDVRSLALPNKKDYPLPAGQYEFVPMPPQEAIKFVKKSSES